MSRNKAVLSIDIGGSKVMVGIVESNGNVIDKLKEPVDIHLTESRLIDIIKKLTSDLKNKHPEIAIEGAGVTVPGLADSEKGIWVYACFNGIRDFNIRDNISHILKVPVFIGNDVNVCAYGEKVYGICKEDSDFLWITISNGIGGGLVLNGDIYEGAFGNAGEIGHINVVENGRLCSCGNRGCLEAHASGRAIAQSYLEKIKNNHAENELYSNETLVTAKTVAQAARDGDKIAIKVYDEAGYYIGKAIAAAVNIINPQKVVLGGGVSQDFDLFIDSLKRTFYEMVFKEANKNLIIEKTGLGYDAALIGAAAIAWRGLNERKSKHI